MKTLRTALLGLLVLALPATTVAGGKDDPPAGTALLQVIHNAADPAAAEVDVYVNGERALDDFAFRAATPFLELPAGVELSVAVAPATSESVEEALATFPVTLRDGRTYVAVANGVLDPTAFAMNPDGRETGFTLFVTDRVKTEGRWGKTALRAVHGATDAPAVDIVLRKPDREGWKRTLYGDVAYGDIGRTEYPRSRPWIVDVTLPGMPETVVASYDADLTALEGGAGIVFASGFLSPADNQQGAAFGLFVALTDGTVLELPLFEPTGYLQVIHNSADPAAAEVDVYVNGERALDDFAFRAATPFLELPAGVELSVAVAPGTSESVDDALATFPVTLAAGEAYVAMATGVLAPDEFAPNPDTGVQTGFTLEILTGAQMMGNKGTVSLVGYHGATDAPRVDIRKVSDKYGNWPLLLDIGYGEFMGYRDVKAVPYEIQVTLAGDRGSVVAAYAVDLTGLETGAAVVFASGFLSPGDNQDGLPFGLFAALPDGSVLELPLAGAPTAVGPDLAKEQTVAAFPAGLDQNYPNPFNPTTTIAFSLPRSGRVSLAVYDMRGRLVTKVIDEQRAAGRHEVSFSGERLASGMYFYRITSGDYVATKTMTLLK